MDARLVIGIIYVFLEVFIPTIVWNKDLVEHFWISKFFVKVLKRLLFGKPKKINETKEAAET